MNFEDTKPPATPEDQEIRDRCVRLFTFLRELAELRTSTVRVLDQYEKVLWFNEIPRESGCHCVAWRSIGEEQQSEVWVEIKKPRLKPPPEVPQDIKPWIDSSDLVNSSLESPSLRERILIGGAAERESDPGAEEQLAFRDLNQSPEVRTQWKNYVDSKWKPWAEEDRRLQKVQKTYTDLFSIYQKQQRLGEAYEVVLGLGNLSWKTPSTYVVKRHLITAQTSLTFDPLRAVIAVGPAGEGPKATLEQDMLEPQERPDPAEQNAVEKQLTEAGDELWDGVRVPSALQAWVHAASPRGNFENSLVPQNEVTADPTVHLAPAIVLRKRTERNMIRILKEIADQIRSGHPIPLGVRRLVETIDDSAEPLNDNGTEEPQRTYEPQSEEIYFPLPTNEEQTEIVRKLSNRQGVLVQGPPGTGKSHTIVNLVCHLLAGGQRVLVTSHTARALKVLRGKFPEAIADLCVLLLGDDLDALQSLEDSVHGINDKYTAWDPRKNRDRIAKLTKDLDEARRTQAELMGRLRAIREAETYLHPARFGTYKGTAKAIAIRLRDEEERFSWLSVRPKEEEEPPLSDAEAIEMLRLLRQINSEREAESAMHFVDPDVLPNPSTVIELIQQESRALEKYEEAEAIREDRRYWLLKNTSQQQREALIKGLAELRFSYDALARHPQSWVNTAAQQILTERERVWRELLATTQQELRAIGDRHKPTSQRRILGLGGRDRSVVRVHAETLLRHLESGGGLGFGPFRPRVVKDSLYLIKEIRVDGRGCDKPQAIRLLLEWVEINDRLDVLRRSWSAYTQPPVGTLGAQVAEYLDFCELLQTSLDLYRKLASLKALFASIPNLPEPSWHISEDLETLQKVVEAIALEDDLEAARKVFDATERLLHSATVSADPHPSLQQALEALKKRNDRQYAEAYRALCGVVELRTALKRREHLFRRLETFAPELTVDLRSSHSNPVWEARTTQFTAAWNWARAEAWLRQFCDPRAYERFIAELDLERARIRQIVRDLAAEKAWAHCFSRLEEHQRQNLIAWAKEMRKIGKATGKYTAMHRRAAREHMEQCRSAIPAWVMPIYRVAESIRPGADVFDVVIVDEASQSGPEALFLQYIGRKVVVVGDDKQIKPDNIGIDRNSVELLRQRHIPDLPISKQFDLENSFFDHAEIKYGGRIRLREHFRCMPEIIQFSNNLCYRSEPLIPLKQYGAGRLEPVIVPRQVKDGYQRGSSPRISNPPEAEALCNQIEACCQDPLYSDKTMGVISLLGEDQARLIESILLETIGPEEMEKRNLVCGDAYAFQGDERDIMFLSLVSAPTEGQRIGVLASERDERRFNVAVSRARDQLWLFHTATLNDLSPHCLRFRLLEYCLNPQVQQTTFAGLNEEDLKELARNADRARSKPPHPFDSWFEVDVLLRISSKGYRVIPQYEIAGHPIDLLVEGLKGRLAVECDGDTWHGAERFEADMARQRMLERCGTSFWRIRESVFYRDPQTALEELWSTLDRHGIHPRGQKAQTAPASALSKAVAKPLR